MAVTLTVEQLRAALRLNDTAEETAEVTRLLGYVSTAVLKHAPDAPDVAHDEAAVRLAAYLFDMPAASRSDAYSNSLRSSGAQRMLLPYRTHRLGLPEALAEAQAALGTDSNPVVDVTYSGDVLTVTYADGGTEDFTIAGGSGVDQTARDSAASAQSAADDAQGEVDVHEASEHNTDQVARDAAASAQTAADAAQGELDTHETSAHNTDQVARDAAIAAGSTASAASGAASAAQATADTNRDNLTDHAADGSAHHTQGGGGGGTDDQTAAEVPVDATGFAGNLGATDTDVQAALGTIDGLALGGGGGGGGDAPDRIVLADAVPVANTAGPHEIALTEAMAARQWLTFFAFTSTAAAPDGIGYLLSDDVLALTPEATAPTDAENALPVVMANYAATASSLQSGNYYVYRKDDSTLWVRPTRLATHTLTITSTLWAAVALHWNGKTKARTWLRLRPSILWGLASSAQLPTVS